VAPKKLKFIGCEIIYREACYLAATSPHRVDLEFLRKGLHDLETPDMVAKMQAAVDAIDPSAGYDAVLLGYARCNDGTVGVTARQVPLVLPRAHDCITLFFGSRQAFSEYFQQHPGTYYMTTGWCERAAADTRQDEKQASHEPKGVMAKLGLNESYDDLAAKYGKDAADYIVQSLSSWQRNYDRFLYLRMGLCEEGPFIEHTRREAKKRGWQFELRDGDWTLLRKLFHGDWDDDFVIVPPGGRIVARNDEWVLDTSD